MAERATPPPHEIGIAEAKDREWGAFILHALDPHRGGYSWQAMDELRKKAREATGLSDSEAAEVVKEHQSRV